MSETSVIMGGAEAVPSVGALGVLVDDVLGCSMNDSLVGASWSVSSDIWIDLLAPLPAAGSRLVAEGHSLHADEVWAYAQGRVFDSGGRLLGTCRQRGRAMSDKPDDLRPPPFELPACPADVTDLLGLVPNGLESMELAITPALANPRRMLHGGVTLCASEVVATRARLARDPALATVSVHIAHTRPISAGATVEFHAKHRHTGRSTWHTDVTGWVEGKVVSVAQVSARSGGAP